MPESRAFLKVEGIKKYYRQTIQEERPVEERSIFRSRIKTHRATVKAVDGVSFQLALGETLGIIGESGCGKSTLGRVLVQIEPMTEGTITIGGRNVQTLLQEDALRYRRSSQMVFQNPFDTFDPRYTLERIFQEVLELHSIGENREERREIILETLEAAGLRPATDYLQRHPHELSGGQLQRISILRAMLLEPSLLVADEPVSMLDVSVRADILRMLEKLHRDHEMAMIFISHDIATTRYVSDRVAVMYLGRIVELASTDEVLHNPRHPYTKVLISNTASLDPLEERKIIEVKGEPPNPVNTGVGCYFAPRCYKAQPHCFDVYPELRELTPDHHVSCHYPD